MSQRSTAQHYHTDTPFCTISKCQVTWNFAVPVPHRRGVVYRQKKGVGSARFHHSARCASKWRRQISRSCAWRLSRIAKFVFFSNVAPKILENAEKAQKKRATRNRLVYRDDAEGDWASICRHRENTSRRQAKKLQPLRKPHSASV